MTKIIKILNSSKFTKNGFSLIIIAFSIVSIGVPFYVNAAMLTRQLEIGMRGDDVSTLQTFLATDVSIYPQGLVTGYFGPLTKSAVSNFLARNGISVVGRVGPITMTAINAQINSGMTTGSDRHGPIISSLNVNTTSTTTSFNWNTNESSAAIVYYSISPLIVTEASSGMGVNISGSTFLVHTDQRIVHAGILTGLSPNTKYYYIVYVRDSAGNVTVTNQNTFLTAN